MFEKGALKHYGQEQLIYNVHNLLHISDDAVKYGSLNNISCFLFESFLGQLKGAVCRLQNPLSQVL